MGSTITADKLTDEEKLALDQYIKDVQEYAPEEWEMLSRLSVPERVEYLVLTGPYAGRYLRECSAAGNRANRLTLISRLAEVAAHNGNVGEALCGDSLKDFKKAR